MKRWSSLFEKPGFLIAIGLILCVAAVFMICNIIYSQSEKDWNNGICSECGGHFQYQQAIGQMYFTRYIYLCDGCGRMVKLSKYKR